MTVAFNKASIAGSGLCAGLLLKESNLMSEIEMLSLKNAAKTIKLEAAAGRAGAVANQSAMHHESESIRLQGYATLTSAGLQLGSEAASSIHDHVAAASPTMKGLQTKLANCESWKTALDKAETANVHIQENSENPLNAAYPSPEQKNQIRNAEKALKSVDMGKDPFNEKDHGENLRVARTANGVGDPTKKNTFDKMIKSHQKKLERAQNAHDNHSGRIEKRGDRLRSIGQALGNAFSTISTCNSAAEKNQQGQEAALQTLAQSTEALFRRICELQNKNADNLRQIEQQEAQTRASIAQANNV